MKDHLFLVEMSNAVNEKLQNTISAGHGWRSTNVSDFVFVCVIPTGRGRGGRGKLHHPLLRADGLGGMSHLNRDTGDVLPCGPVNRQGGRQEAQTGSFWTRLVHNAGLSHQGVLSGRHTGCTQGKVLKLSDL